MRLTKLEVVSGWPIVYQAALATQGKMEEGWHPATEWRRSILKAEHSPIRALQFFWTWEDMPYWVSVHISRHKIGIEHFVSTQRTDRTGVDRDSLPQNSPVMHSCLANAQALISISRKRLCHKASRETRLAWEALRDHMREIDPVVADAMVPDCAYRGKCPEMKSCGYPEKSVDVSE